jgi:predicted Zn-dependent protease
MIAFGRKPVLTSAVALGVLVGAAAPALGHVALDHQLADLTRRIERDPRDASLYLRRGELHRARGEWSAAEADYLRAREIAPGLVAVDLCLGRMYLESEKPGPAKEALDRFLVARPEHAEGHALRARALGRLGQKTEAAAGYTRALALLRDAEHPRKVDYYLERAQLLAGEGGPGLEQALRGLDEGMSALGPLVTLQLSAIDLELRAGRPEAALARLDSIAATFGRREAWLVRRAKILEQCGRLDEARDALEDALARIRALPASRRGAPAVRRIESEAGAALERLRAQSAPPAEHPAP